VKGAAQDTTGEGFWRNDVVQHAEVLPCCHKLSDTSPAADKKNSRVKFLFVFGVFSQGHDW